MNQLLQGTQGKKRKKKRINCCKIDSKVKVKEATIRGFIDMSNAKLCLL